ncbi:3-phosphoshikimate 1-carboxyvinyltransferase [Devosia algicola]|uniref:3-phosphoshikimate 1-carboxyvinyltransferase n=1 Tax=Devosia algicola TaxID=3026418 RepID=A0ABY7YLN9_9HYPH|nr:3-phosphoshikimate 1-carboxyvinyltransferase [Devosia algicola]WDR01974.1 3-phosphoshikimate 1-carboxyvinyltransferase [Devosia algicola]
MASQPDSARPTSIARATALKGQFTIIGDAAISHRALILGATALGQTIIKGLRESVDVLATAQAMRAFGARVEKHDGHWSVDGLGVGGLMAPTAPIDFGGSATSARLTIGLAAPYSFATSFIGDASLSARPMRRILDPLMAIGVEVIEHADYQLPLTLRGPKLVRPLDYRLPIASSKVKSTLLMAGLNIAGTTTIIEPVATRDHTENLLRQFGADVRVTTPKSGDAMVEMAGLPDLRAQNLVIPGDPSAAAFPIVAALIVPGSELVIDNVLMSTSRTGLIDTLLEMGGNISFFNQRQIGGEDIADLRVRHSNLRGLTIPADRVAAMIDDYPILAIAAAFAEGETTMLGIGDVRPVHTERLASVVAGLAANGVEARLDADSVRISGGAKKTGGARVATNGDSRVAMSFLVMGMATSQPVALDDQSMTMARLADFISGFSALGVEFETTE